MRVHRLPSASANFSRISLAVLQAHGQASMQSLKMTWFHYLHAHQLVHLDLRSEPQSPPFRTC